jgi:hypothetical protein
MSFSVPSYNIQRFVITVSQFPHAFSSETILVVLASMDSEDYSQEKWNQNRSDLEAVLRIRNRVASHNLQATMMPPGR